MTCSLFEPNVHVFQKGIYTVVLANDASLIADALHRVPAERRPTIAPELLEFYVERFPQWHLALCCFSNRDATTSNPLLWWYETMFPDVLLAPAIDCHSGKAPSLCKATRRDHDVVFGSYRPGDSWQVRDVSHELHPSRLPSAVRALMPTYAVCFGRRHEEKNRDYLMDVASLHGKEPAMYLGILGDSR